jgi:hypothetical protein
MIDLEEDLRETWDYNDLRNNSGSIIDKIKG